MKKFDNSKFLISFQKVVDTIKSCKTEEQIESARKLSINFVNLYTYGDILKNMSIREVVNYDERLHDYARGIDKLLKMRYEQIQGNKNEN